MEIESNTANLKKMIEEDTRFSTGKSIRDQSIETNKVLGADIRTDPNSPKQVRRRDPRND